MTCPKCGTAVPPGSDACPSCQTPFLLDKVLCEGCHGAYPPHKLSLADGRLLCPVCRGRTERAAAGIPEPGLARMTAWHMAPEPPRRSRLAAASLVFAFLVPPLAPLLGIAALVRIEAARGRLTGRGLALAGTLLGLAIVAAAVALGVAFREPLESRLAPLAGKAAPPPARGSAPGSIRKISEAQSKFREKTGSFGSLEELWRSGLLDRADPGDGAYKFDVFLAPSRKKYSVTAVPRGAEKLYYLLDEEGKLRFEEGRPAVSPGSPLWEERENARGNPDRGAGK